MKKLFKKLNNKTIRSVVFGLILAFTMMAGTSIASAAFEVAHIQAVAVPFLGPSTSLLSKIGSLTVGASSSASWIINSFGECINSGNNKRETCLDVSGSGTFANLVVEQTAHILGNLTVSQLGVYGGSSGFVGIVPTLTIEDTAFTNPTAAGLYIKGLGRTNGGGGFNPLDTVTRRDLCADADGTLAICI